MSWNWRGLTSDVGAHVRPFYLLGGERISKSWLADMPEFLIALLIVAVRQASRDFRHWAGALAVNDPLMQRSCARSHWGMSTSPTSAKADDNATIREEGRSAAYGRLPRATIARSVGLTDSS